MSGHHITTPNVYIKVLLSLMVLMVLTVAVAKVPALDFSQSINLGIALTIAIFKTLLVVLFFMQVKYSSGLVKAFAACGFLWLIIMFVLFFTDFATRDWIGNLVMN